MNVVYAQYAPGFNPKLPLVYPVSPKSSPKKSKSASKPPSPKKSKSAPKSPSSTMATEEDKVRSDIKKYGVAEFVDGLHEVVGSQIKDMKENTYWGPSVDATLDYLKIVKKVLSAETNLNKKNASLVHVLYEKLHSARKRPTPSPSKKKSSNGCKGRAQLDCVEPCRWASGDNRQFLFLVE